MERTLVWAHRGASGYAPENTMEAFRKAYEMEATTILSGSGSDDEIGIDNSNSFEDACSNKGFFMEDEN